ncbi:MAG TPA: ABC transporter ATP-binding protein [Candidatus Sumerlaeota bacterium]|nr:ABC transporter ATP-binding protein [Candidatus Sumerlaeota bacterium]
MFDLLRFLYPYCRRYKWKYVWGVVTVIVTNVLMVRANVLVGRTVDAIFRPDMSAAGVAGNIALIAVCVAVGSISLYMQRILLIGTSRVIEYELRNDFFGHLMRLSASFFDRSKTGDILARATSDIEQIRMALGPGILYPLTAVAILPTTLWAMFSASWPVALFSLAPMLLLPLVVSLMANLTYKRSLKVQEHYSDFSGRIQESITGIRVVKAYVQREHELETLNEGNRRNAALNLELAKVSAAFHPTLMTLFVLGTISILWNANNYLTADAALAASTKMLTKGDLLSFVLLYRYLFFPILRFGWVISAMQRAAASMVRLRLIWALKPEIQDTEETDTSLDRVEGAIEIRNLTFTYPKAIRPSLVGVNLKLGAGRTLGIVGPVGCGKSTLGRLIARLYDPPENTVFLDGHDVRRYPLAVLRGAVGIVFQETYLFSDTVRENIRFGLSAEVSEEDVDRRVRESARIAAVEEEVERLPNQYDTILGERGVNLSGGQKQRVSLARAVASGRPILILDDAFASVDTHTEERILRGLRDVMKERTTILISHRISTVQLADEIIVLAEGRIAEQGTHAELLKKRGLYYDIYERQLLEESVEEANGR